MNACSPLIAEYARWWAPIVEEIVIDKNRAKKKETTSSTKKSEVIQFLFSFYISVDDINVLGVFFLSAVYLVNAILLFSVTP